MSRSAQRQEELAKRKHFHPIIHRYHHSVLTGRCLICGGAMGDHEDEPANQEEPGENTGGGDSAPAAATGGGGGAAAGGGGAAAGP